MNAAFRLRAATAFAVVTFTVAAFGGGSALAQGQPASNPAPASQASGSNSGQSGAQNAGQAGGQAQANPSPTNGQAGGTTTETKTVTGPGAGSSTAANPLPEHPAPRWFVLTVIGVCAAVGIVFLLFLRGSLGPSKWNLSDALSEESNLPVEQPGGAGPVMNNGQVVLAPQLVASTSRLIALMGMFGILMLYLGFGGFVLYYFGTGQRIPPDTPAVGKFLLTGLTLFAPYTVNRFANVFESFAPKP